MRVIILALGACISGLTQADFTQQGNTLTFDDQWWQVENAWPASGIVCSGGSGDSCALDAGSYKWVGSTGEGEVFITTTTTPLASANYSVSDRVYLPESAQVSTGSLKAQAECILPAQVVGVLSCTAELRGSDLSQPATGYVNSFFYSNSNLATCAVNNLDEAIAPNLVITIKAVCGSID